MQPCNKEMVEKITTWKEQSECCVRWWSIWFGVIASHLVKQKSITKLWGKHRYHRLTNPWGKHHYHHLTKIPEANVIIITYHYHHLCSWCSKAAAIRILLSICHYRHLSLSVITYVVDVVKLLQLEYCFS